MAKDEVSAATEKQASAPGAQAPSVPGQPGHKVTEPGRVSFFTRIALSPRLHEIFERTPLFNRVTRREGRALFDVVAGFVHSQALLAIVEFRILHILAEASWPLPALADRTGLAENRLAVLMQAGAALKLVKFRRGMWELAPRGAAFITVPGLEAMVRHHPVLYRDLADPVAFLKGDIEPELAGFWPYVFGPLAQEDAGLAERYSQLMADSQRIVADDTLRLVDLKNAKRLMDVGGGTGTFLRQAAKLHPNLDLTLFDLPHVLAVAEPFSPRLTLAPGSFRDDPIPTGADVISLVRVLYDHPDNVVEPLLKKVHDALPPGGRIVVSEAIGGGAKPDPACDIYFAFYTMAMSSGRTRNPEEIKKMLEAAGFVKVTKPRSLRPFITSVIEAERG
ncbi:hydroxyneurosporene-O-methyltransferase [Rhodobacter aestuarii]|uniref:Hydroxyneurosporene-O-methyltransferase n=1 Tax=Rhodobacter aestuarii TaxID=453582 RepID=A0A1N7MKJ5_9RHOB|nr:methyltransferase [Rhodobacter aestuarii]PTV96704.1 hydroxyneurosporene-O-methyltransferase [Rhodobacter aestuarii]SIS86459.1 hydroxyneurosporene-O-methyltransferase [Rhodobacter aestuarii]